MNFKTLLVYVPAADFTQPYPAIPYLAGYLRNKGEDVIIEDLNIDAHEYLFSEEFLEKCRKKVENRFASLNKKNSLNLDEQNEYLKCLEALGVNPNALKPGEFPGGVYGFRDTEKFFDFKEYQKNSVFLKQALTVISSAYYPTRLTAAEYTTPFFLGSREDIIEQTGKAFNPFVEFYVKNLIPLVEKEKPGLIGISVTYPSQVLQMFAVANLIKKKFPGIHICAGGAFLCRTVLNMPQVKFKTLFNYLDSIVLYEGETALYKLISYLKADGGKRGKYVSIPNVIYYDRAGNDIKFPPGDPFMENLEELPPPDFDGFPMDKYLSPTLVLPYAPTRGCYWNKCAFCHYGATKEGTARYRERSAEKVIDDMEFLADRWQVNNFAFSIDVMSPAMALNIADEMIKRKRSFRWNSEIKIEKNFTGENCKKLEQGGCLSVAIGLESGNDRILELIEKGFTSQLAGEVIGNFSDAGICVQVMSFLDFPTETTREALETIEFISRNKEHISLFTLGNFELLPGSRVFKNPQDYGLADVYYASGDEFKILCLFKKKRESKLEEDAEFLDSAYYSTAEQYAGLEFPFAGAVSTNHTFLYFERFGKDIFKTLDFLGDTGKKEPGKVLDRLSRPKLSSRVKLIKGNFNSREIGESLEAGTNFLKEIMNKTGESYRKALQKTVGKNKVFSSPTFYILLDDEKWSELPGQVKVILDLCSGENTVEAIAEFQGKENVGFIMRMLEGLLSVNIIEI